jgi:hypothetical protein
MNQQSNPLRGAETLAPNNSPLKARLATKGAAVRLGAVTRLIAHAKGYADFTLAERRKAND